MKIIGYIIINLFLNCNSDNKIDCKIPDKFGAELITQVYELIDI